MKTIQDFRALNQIKACLFDFDGVFTDNTVLIDEAGGELVRCSRIDGYGIESLKKKSILTAIISSEAKPNVLFRSQKLGITCFHNTADKVKTASAFLADNNLMFNQCAFVGNDINDITLLEHVLFPICPPNAHPAVISLDLIYLTRTPGGLGCVREVCDLLTA
jgi:3-deoxy-D-manno-octulosonate 8-phosphate phosphatase (KDO 8-P phosphatase)